VDSSSLQVDSWHGSVQESAAFGAVLRSSNALDEVVNSRSGCTLMAAP